MAECYLGEIRMFGGNYAPRYWAFCQGQLLAISKYSALYSLLGTAYGGDGITSFGIPDLRGRIPVHQGSGPLLTPRHLGQTFGHETVTLTMNQTPAHNHLIHCTNQTANSSSPIGRVPAAGVEGDKLYVTTTDSGKLSALAPAAIAPSGESDAHDNLMPAQCISFIIALIGTFPSRN